LNDIIMADQVSLSNFQSYNDFGALGRLKGEAAKSPNHAIKETAKQFEAHFLQQLMKTMRATVDKSDLHGQDQVQIYEEMMDKEVAMQMSKHGGIGLAKMLEAQLQKSVNQPLPKPVSEAKPLALEKVNPGLPLTAPAPALNLPSGPVKGYQLRIQMGEQP
jgi:flagellar protein FlgJ